MANMTMYFANHRVYKHLASDSLVLKLSNINGAQFPIFLEAYLKHGEVVVQRCRQGSVASNRKTHHVFKIRLLVKDLR